MPISPKWPYFFAPFFGLSWSQHELYGGCLTENFSEGVMNHRSGDVAIIFHETVGVREDV